jgi:hypothetical protein
MSVESFDPSAAPTGLDDETIAALCALVPSDDTLTLSAADVSRFAPASKHEDWSGKVACLADDDIVGLIRLFTLGEEQYAEWSAGAQSPVVALVRELKSRGVYTPELTRWIKGHTSNKFLPHGSLMDRL